MSTNAGTILEGAYNRSAMNDPGKLASDGELLAHLDRVYQRTWALIARARPDAFSSGLALSLVGIPPQATLPADLIDILSIETAAGVPVSLVPIAEQRRSWNLAPCVVRQGMTLRSRNQGGDPVSGTALSVSVLDAPAALTARTSVLDARWPVRHVQLLVDLVATYLGTKDEGRDATQQKKLVDETRANGVALAAEFGLPPAAVEWMHAPVERAGSTS